MATLNTPGTGSDDGGQVVSLDAARAAHPARTPPRTPARPGTGPDTAAGHDGPVLEGEVSGLTSPARTGPTGWPTWRPARRTAARSSTRRCGPAAKPSPPPGGWRRHYRHVALYHPVRVPKYGGKLAVRAPRGFTRTVSGLMRWAYDLEGHPVRMATVLKADPEAYLKLSRQRDSRVRLRVPIAILAGIAALAAAVLALTAPAPVKLAILAAAVAVFGKLGAPADRPLIDRAVAGPRVEKLTSDIVIRALGALGIAAINQAIAKNPRTAIEFKAPITRDGPGWRADLDLPYGVTVAEVMDRRDKLASGLRRQLGCVWPEADHAQHTGRLILWVGDQDMSTARQPALPLAKPGTADLFKAVPFGTDQRGRPGPGDADVRVGHHRVHPAHGQDVPAAPAGA